MDRYNDLKIQLKQWEHSFVQTHNRKPNKVSSTRYTFKLFWHFLFVPVNLKSVLFSRFGKYVSEVSFSTESVFWAESLIWADSQNEPFFRSIPATTLFKIELLPRKTQFYTWAWTVCIKQHVSEGCKGKMVMIRLCRKSRFLLVIHKKSQNSHPT